MARTKEVKKILIVENDPEPKLSKFFSRARTHWPGAEIFCLVKNGTKVSIDEDCNLNIINRRNPLSVTDGFKLWLQIKRMKFDVILLKKDQINFKIMLSFMSTGSRSFLIDTHAAGNKMFFERFDFKSLFVLLRKKRILSFSLVASVVPLFLLLLSIPVLFMKPNSSNKRRGLLRTIRTNFFFGSFGDTPWLWAWLQVAMVWMLILDKPRTVSNPIRILLIRNDKIGDAVVTVPLARQIKKRYPSSHVSVLCDVNQFMWESCPYIDEILIYKTNNRYLGRRRFSLRNVLQPLTSVRRIRKKRFDIVIDPIGRTENHILVCLSGALQRICACLYEYRIFDTDMRRLQRKTEMHEIERLLSLVKDEKDITPVDCRLEMWIQSDARKRADKVFEELHLSDGQKLLGIHAGAATALRCWPLERWASVANELALSYGMKIVFFEPPGMSQASSKFNELLGRLNQKAVVIKDMDLHQLTASIAKCSLFLCSDSGPMHLAAAVEAPTVAIFGPGEYIRWRPLHKASAVVRKDIICSPCSQEICKDPQCVLAVQTSDVLEAAATVLDGAVSVPAKLV